MSPFESVASSDVIPMWPYVHSWFTVLVGVVQAIGEDVVAPFEKRSISAPVADVRF